MSEYSAEQAENDLTELNTLLQAWQGGLSPGDRVSGSDLQRQDYLDASTLTQEIIRKAAPQQRLQLTIGATAIEAVRFSRTPYDRPDMRFTDIEPGCKHELRSSRTVSYTIGERREELFVGLVTKVALSEVARTLTEGGELSFIGAPNSSY